MFLVFSLRVLRQSWVFLPIVFAVMMVSFSHPLLIAKESWGAPLQGKRIALDAGHGGPDGGAQNARGTCEKNITLKIVKYLRSYLESAGAQVVLTRESDKDLADENMKGLARRKAIDLRNRMQLVHDFNPHVFVSVHLNTTESVRWSGAQTFFNPRNRDNRQLALDIQRELGINLDSQRVVRPKNNVYILRESEVATALVEAGFLSHPEESLLLEKDYYQKKVAAAIYYGILRYLDK